MGGFHGRNLRALAPPRDHFKMTRWVHGIGIVIIPLALKGPRILAYSIALGSPFQD